MAHELRVVLVIGRPGVASWCFALVACTPGLAVVGWFATVADAVCCLPNLSPDVCIVDSEDFAELAADRLRTTGSASGPLVVALRSSCASAYEDSSTMRTFRIGGSRSDFLAAVGDDGPQVACSIPAETRELTAREREIALLVAEGFSNEELANMLMLSVATVKNHVHSILKKLDVGRRWHVGARLRGSLAATSASVHDGAWLTAAPANSSQANTAAKTHRIATRWPDAASRRSSNWPDEI